MIMMLQQCWLGLQHLKAHGRDDLGNRSLPAAVTKQHSLLNVQHPPDSPTLCNLAGKTFGAAVGGFKVLALLEASQEVVEASGCEEESEGKKVQRKPIILCISQPFVELAVKSSGSYPFSFSWLQAKVQLWLKTVSSLGTSLLQDL